MDLAYTVFWVEFILTNLVFSTILSFVFIFYNKNKVFNNIELWMYSLGLGPAFTVLILYYLFLLLPGFKPYFYLIFIFLFYCLLGFLYRKSFSVLSENFYKGFHPIKKLPKHYQNINLVKSPVVNISLGKYRPDWRYVMVLIMFAGYFTFWMNRLYRYPIVGHDMLEYAIQAKIFIHDRALKYMENRYDDYSKFYYVGLHGFSFPLLGSWENLLDTIFKIKKDYYFKSITGYYALLIFIIQFNFLSKKNFWLAISAVIISVLTAGYYMTILEFHIDMYRIFFLIVSWIFLVYSIKINDYLSLVIFALFTGTHAFAHSLGAIMIFLNIGVLFLFLNDSLSVKIKKSLLAFAICFFMGGIHYLLDTFYGTGWIFQEIKYY